MIIANENISRTFITKLYYYFPEDMCVGYAFKNTQVRDTWFETTLSFLRCYFINTLCVTTIHQVDCTWNSFIPKHIRDILTLQHTPRYIENCSILSFCYSILFCEYGVIIGRQMSFFLQKSLNCLDLYSPPLSDWSTLIW